MKPPLIKPDSAISQSNDRNIPIASVIVAIALALFVAMPVIAVGAAVAIRVFCWIAGVC